MCKEEIIMTTNCMSNYSYGPNCFDELPAILAGYGFTKVVFIGGKRALASSQTEVKQFLSQANVEVTASLVYGVESTQANIDRLVATEEVAAADVIFGFGGGKALDTAKMVAMELAKPIFTFPTICSNCSAGTAVAVIYHDDGSFDRYGFPPVPLHVFINTQVIANAPAKYFWAGIGDGISKAPEVAHCVAHAKETGMELPHTATLGAAIAASSKDAFYQYGPQGITDVKNNLASRAVEEVALDIVVSTGYASNLVNQKEFYFNSCHAHAFYNATTAIKREGEYLHGQIVSFGVLVLHAYYQEDEELQRVLAFNHRLGLPVTLAQLGLSQADIPKLVEVAMTTNEYKHLPFGPDQFAAAIKRADELGQALS